MNKEFDPEEIKTRFIQIMDKAIEESWKGAHNRMSFARVINCDKNQVNGLSQKGRHVTVQMIWGMVTQLGINPIYILTGKGPIQLQKESEVINSILKIEKVISDLKKQGSKRKNARV